ncbi:SUMF1/EgtB/PvdO family nonheme iron enzyme [candidate division KSB1 bacterium]|nr:SUMF1/EgtB/PvdO family nonheme iron enzyme [candidate division KSB1 bacterium]
MKRGFFVFISLLILPASFAQQAKLHLIGEPRPSSTDIVAVKDDKSGQFCSAVQIITDLTGFGYSSELGVVKVDFSKPGRDMVFLLPDDRFLEIYHPDYEPKKLIFSELGIQLEPRQTWLVKISGDAASAEGIAVVINANVDSVSLMVDGEQKGVVNGGALMLNEGNHEIRLQKTEYETLVDTLSVDAEQKPVKYNLVRKLVFVSVKGGSFAMGNNNSQRENEKPQHEVKLNEFYVSKTEVTNAQFCRFLNEKGNQEVDGVPWVDWQVRYQIEEVLNPDLFTDQPRGDVIVKNKIRKEGDRFVVAKGFENHPVSPVSWHGANAFCQWIGGRLPTEAEWEYTARGGHMSEGFVYAGSDVLDAVAWHSGNSLNQSRPVAVKRANELGIHDMSGNVCEWCFDWYGETYYRHSPNKNPTGPATGKYRVLRGGCWGFDAFLCRTTCRFSYYEILDMLNRGIRVVRDKP